MTTSPMSEVVRHLRRVALPDGARPSDGQLLDRFIAGRDEAAFEELVRRHGPMVLGVCRRLLHQPHDADDAFQATFLVLVRKARSVRPREMVGNFLYGVACRTALKARTLAAVRNRRERQVAHMPEAPAPAPPSWDELRPQFDQELSRLPDKFRVPIVLCDLEGRSQQESARQLGWPQGTLTGRLSVGRALLAKRLARRGLTLSAAALAGLLSAQTASASVAPALLASTVTAASMTAANGTAAALVSARVAALTEGVLRAMFLTRLKIAATGLLVVVLTAGLGAGLLTRPALAEKPTGEPLAAPTQERRGDERRGEERPGGERNPEERRPQTPAAFTGKIVEIGKNGKIALEMPPANRGGEPTKVEVMINDRTQLVYFGVGPDGAKLTLGYQAAIWLAEGSKDVARMQLTGPVSVRRGADLSLTVARVSPDGKVLTFKIPSRTREDEEKTIDVRLTDKTVVSYSYIARDGAKPTAGYHAEVYLERDSKEKAFAVHFFGDVERPQRGVPEARPDAVGRVLTVTPDAKVIVVEVQGGRGEEATQHRFKLDDSTRLVFLTVGPDGAKPTVGQRATIWLAEGSKDTAARISFQGAVKEREELVVGKVVAVAPGGKGVTLEIRPQGREEAPRKEIKFNDKTEIVFHGVGPGGAKPTEGQLAQVWLEEGSKDTAARVLFGAAVGGDRR
jgi:RNA polymerase sigma factor (sigma-70 family)